MTDSAEREGPFSVFFFSNKWIDEEEVKRDFSKFGIVTSVKRIDSKIFVNFRHQHSAENCLLNMNSQYGEIKYGKYTNTQNMQVDNCAQQNVEIDFAQQNIVEKDHAHYSSEERKKPRSSFASQFSHSCVINERNRKDSGDYRSGDGDDEDEWCENKSLCSYKADKFGKKNDKGSQNNPIEGKGRISEAKLESQYYVVDEFPSKYVEYHSDSEPSFSRNDGLPPLLSVGDNISTVFADESCPPPLVSGQNYCYPIPVRSSNKKRGLLPTPPISMRLDYKPDLFPPGNSVAESDPNLTVKSHDNSDIPPLLCASSYTRSKKRSKFEKHMMIVNLPKDTTPEEVEKVLYPHIPDYVGDLDVTNVSMELYFCVAAFHSKEEASKAVRYLFGVELRGHRLCTVRCDQLERFYPSSAF